MNDIKSLLEKQGYIFGTKLPRSRNDVYLIEKNGVKFVLKTNSTPELRDSILNELEWYKNWDKLRKAGVTLPVLVDSKIIGDNIYLMTEYVEGKSIEELISNSEFSDENIEQLAQTIHSIETLPYINTIVSSNKRKLNPEDWNNVFHNNKAKWSTYINGNTHNSEIKDFVDFLTNTASKFNIQNLGYGTLHGSSKMIEFIFKESTLTVLDWEKASGVYINYYETAGISSYIAIRLSKPDIAEKLLIQRRKHITSFTLPFFDRYFYSLLAQRILGDIYDLYSQNEINEIELIKNIPYLKSIFQA
jgi:hypothetical protein